MRIRSAMLAMLVVASPAAAQQDGGSGQNGPGTNAGAGANAGEAQQKPQAPDALLGDWGGIKSGLTDAGIKPLLGYKGEFAANVSGGERHDATLVGQLDIGATLDTEKLIGLAGGTLQTSITFRHGHDLGQRAGLDVLQQVQEVYGRGQTWRLTELWYQQVAADGHLVLKAGRFPAGDFNTFDCEFQNLTFCGAPAGNLTGTYWFNWPIAQWSGWVKARSDRFYVKAGVNEDNRNNLDNAFFLGRGGAKGVIYHLETGWTPAFGGGKRPGRYQAGFWYTTSRDDDALLDVTRRPVAVTGLAPLQREGQYGIYAQAEQQLTGEATIDPVSGVITRTRGLNVFANFTRNDPRTATTLDQETLGLYVNAPFASRPKDQIGLGVGRTHYSARAATALVLADATIGRRRNEYVGELYYGYNALPGIVLRPNLQYILDPGGIRQATDVVVLAFRFDVNL